MTHYRSGTDSAWFSFDDEAVAQGDPITLVTLQLNTAADAAALQFIEGAEHRALAEWAKRGKVLMALVSECRSELNLVVACHNDHSRVTAEAFPSVVSDMAQVKARSVTALPLVGLRRFITH